MDLIASIAVGAIAFFALFVLVYWMSGRRPTKPVVDDVYHLRPASEAGPPARRMAARDVPHSSAGAEWSRNRIGDSRRYRNRPSKGD